MIRRITRARLLGSGTLVDIDIDAAGMISSVTRTVDSAAARIDSAVAALTDLPALAMPGWPESTSGTVGASVDTLDTAGRYVTSGLWDEHVHFGQWAQQAARLDFGELTSAEQVLDRVANVTAEGAKEIIAMRVRGSTWGDSLTRERIDAVSDGVPVVLISVDLHGAWLNSSALQRYGHDPRGTSHITEDDCFALVRELDRIADDELDRRVASAASAAAARGVVGVVDFEMRWGMEDWVRRERSGFGRLRVESAIYPQYLERAISAGLRSGDALSESGRLRVGPLKVITDGSLGTHTAWCCEPYPGGKYGRSLVGQNELEGLLRHEDIARFAQLGIEASVQPEHLLDDREAIAKLWPGRAERAFPFASLLDNGARLHLGSDAPVAPLDPWRAIAAAVHRSLPGEPSWVPAERLTVEQALSASMRGQLHPVAGDQADLILLARDPLRMSHTELMQPTVCATILGGMLTYIAAAAPAPN